MAPILSLSLSLSLSLTHSLSLSSGGLTLGQVEEEGEATLPWYQPRRSLSTGVAAPAPAACAGSPPRDHPPPVAKVFGQATTAPAARAPQHAAAVALPWTAAAGASTSVHIARQLSSSNDETGVSSSGRLRPAPPRTPGFAHSPHSPVSATLSSLTLTLTLTLVSTSTGHSPSAARTMDGVSLLAGANVSFSSALRPSPLGEPAKPTGQGGFFSSSGLPAAPTAPTAPTAAPPLPLGYGAPLQGFDLSCFMHAVTCAVEPLSSGPGAPKLESRGSSGSSALNENDLHDLFEVSHRRSPRSAPPTPPPPPPPHPPHAPNHPTRLSGPPRSGAISSAGV